jgi:hypothetical protein
MTSATSQAETTVDDGRTGRSYLSGGLLVAGGVWALVGNVLHPRFDQQNQAAVYRAVHIQSDRLLFADLLLILATLLITAGLLELARALSRRHASALARIGGAAVAIGGGIAVVQYVVEAYGLRQGAHLFAIVDYRNQMGAFWATSAVDWINTALFSAWTLLLLGCAPLLLAPAMWNSSSYPKWVTVVGVVGGIGCLFTAVVNISREDQTTLQLLFFVASILVTLWVILTGWFELLRSRDARATDSRAAESYE